LRRAGLDYWPLVKVAVWSCLEAYLGTAGPGRRLVAATVRGETPVQRMPFAPGDSLLFGPETMGLPEAVLALAAARVYIPQCPGTVRSLNLSTAVGIILYQAMAACGLLDAWPPGTHAPSSARG
jgi:tRNA (cytidine/uridine-2'-O-)-methyltransferase